MSGAVYVLTLCSYALVFLPQGREWFYDERDQTLIYKPNSTAMPTGGFVATSLKVLFNISGTKQEPAHHMVITGVTLRDTAYTYFGPSRLLLCDGGIIRPCCVVGGRYRYAEAA